MPTNDESMPIEPEAPITPEAPAPEAPAPEAPANPMDVHRDGLGAVLRGGREDARNPTNATPPPMPVIQGYQTAARIANPTFTNPNEGQEYKSSFSSVDTHFQNLSQPEAVVGDHPSSIDPYKTIEGSFSDNLRKRDGTTQLDSVEPSPTKTDDGLNIGNRQENAALTYNYDTAKKDYALWLISRDDERTPERPEYLRGQGQGVGSLGTLPSNTKQGLRDELGPDFDPDNFDADEVMAAAGMTPDDMDRHRENWYKIEGFKAPSSLSDSREGEASNPELAAQTEARIAEQRADARKIYGFEVFDQSDHTEEELTDWIMMRGGYERGEAARIAAGANSTDAAWRIMAAQQKREQFHASNRLSTDAYGHSRYVGRDYADQHVDDDLGRYSVGYGDAFVNGLVSAGMKAVPLAGAAGASIYSFFLRAAGDEEGAQYFDDYTASVAEYVQDMGLNTAMIGRAIKQGDSAFDSDAVTEWCTGASELAGMLAFDIGTSLLTGGTSLLSRVAVKGTASLATATAKGTAGLAGRATVGVGRKAADAAKSLYGQGVRVTTRPGTVTEKGVRLTQPNVVMLKSPAEVVKAITSAAARASGGYGRSSTSRMGGAAAASATVDGTAVRSGLGQIAGAAAKARGAVSGAASGAANATYPSLVKFAGKKAHAPNTFLTRIYGESYATSMARQEDRAMAAGRPVSITDNLLAMADATAHTAIAHLIGKNIPGRGKFPKSGKGSSGYLTLKGKQGFAPTTLEAAKAMSVSRTLMGLNRGGADFVMFELLMDAYSLTDHEDRVQTMRSYMNHTDEKVQHLFGSYLMGMAIKVPGVPRTAREPFKKFKEFKSGREAHNFLQTLPKSEQLEIFDAMSDARKQGYATEMRLQKNFVNENSRLMAEFTREELAHIAFYGDRALPDANIATQTGSEKFEAYRTIPGERVQGRNSRELINENGQVEVTRAMAMAALGRKEGVHGSEGQGQTAVEYMGGKVDLLFATRAETQARKKETLARSERERNNIPEVPSRGVTGVRGFAEAINRVIERHPRVATIKQVYDHLTTAERRSIGEAAQVRAMAAAVGRGDAAAVRRIRGLGRRQLGELSRLNHPDLRPHAFAAIHERGLAKAAGTRMEKSPEFREKFAADKSASKAEAAERKASEEKTLIDRVMASNKPLVTSVVRKVAAGKNTPKDPAISRNQMNRLAGGTLPKNKNFSRARYLLARILESKVNSELQLYKPHSDKPLERPDSPSRYGTDIVNRTNATGNAARSVPVTKGNTIAEVAKSTVEPISNPFEGPRLPEHQKEMDRRTEESTRAGDKPLELAPVSKEPKEAAKPKEGSERLSRVDETIERLESPDQVETPLRTPFEVRDSSGAAVFEGAVRERVANTLKYLKGLGVESVEVDFGEAVGSGMGESLFALGRANGYSIVIAKGAKLPSIIDRGNGVLVISSRAGAETARAQIASRGATLKWISSMPPKSKPLHWLWHMGQFGGLAEQMKIAYESHFGTPRVEGVEKPVSEAKPEAKPETLTETVERQSQELKEHTEKVDPVVWEERRAKTKLEAFESKMQKEGLTNSEIRSLPEYKRLGQEANESYARVTPEEFAAKAKEQGLDVVSVETMNDRDVVVVRSNGRLMPFYLSTGHGGKADVAAGRWYLFLGMGEGWVNKGSQDSINRFYGSKEAMGIAEKLNEATGKQEPLFKYEKGAEDKSRTRESIDAFNKRIGLENVVHEQSKELSEANRLTVQNNHRIITGFESKPESKPETATESKPEATPEAATEAKSTTTKEFLTGLLQSGKDVGQNAAVFESLFPFLPREIQGQIASMRPVEIAKWIALQKVALESVGYGPTRKNNTVIGGTKATEGILAVAESGEGFANTKGTIKRNFLRAIKDAVERRNELVATNEQIIAEARTERRVIEEAATEGSTAKPLSAKDQMRRRQLDARIQTASERKPSLDLFQADGKANVTALRMMEQRYPGFVAEAVRQVNANIGRPSTFEHMGMKFTVTARRHNGKLVPNKVEYHPTELAVENPMVHEASLPAESKEASDKARSLLLSSETRNETTETELVASTEPPAAPPLPPGTTEYSHDSGSPTSRQTSFRQLRLRAMRLFMDQLNLSLGLESGMVEKPMHDGVKVAFETEQRIEGQKQERQDTFERMMRTIEKDPNSELAHGKNKNLLIEILETPINPTMQSMLQHPMTKHLTKNEMEVIVEIKKTFEEHRQEYAQFLRKGAGLGYKYAATDKIRQERANEFDPSLNVEIVKTRGAGKENTFRVNDGEARVTMGREAFIEFMANKHVPESWGNKHAYFPHLFFSNTGMRASVEATLADGTKVTQKFGISKENKRELEHGELLTVIESHIAEFKGRHPEATYKINVKEGSRRLNREAMHLTSRQKKALVSALRSETKGSSSSINAALAGKVTTRPVDKAFLSALLKREGAKNYSTDVSRVFNVALNNHYRNKLSREMNEATEPHLRKLEEGVQNGTHPEWAAEHFREMLRHAVYGTNTAFKIAEQAGGHRFAIGVERTLSNLRALQFYRQLARVGQHFINSTQSAQVWSLIGSEGFADAVRKYNSAEGKQFLKDHGFFDVNGKFETGKFGDSLQGNQLALLQGIHKAVNSVTGKVWNANSEARNQNFSFFALANHAQKNLNMSPTQAAAYGRLWGSLFTQYRYSKVNDPVFLRGSVMKTLGQFKRFQVQTLGMAHSLYLNMRNPEATEGIPRGAFARFMLLNTVTAGLRGSLIGVAAVLAGQAGSALYQSLRSAMDDDYTKGMPDETPFASQEQALVWLTSKYGSEAGDMLSMGVLAGVGLDTSGTFNLTNIGYDGIVGYLGGPTYGMFKRLHDDAFVKKDALGRGASVRMFESFVESGQATRSMKSLWELCQYWDKFGQDDPAFDSTMLGLFSPNKYRSGTSELVGYRTLFDGIADTLGLRSKNGTKQFMQHSVGMLWTEEWNRARNEISTAYNRDPAEADRKMFAWNQAYGSKLPMYWADIKTMAENNEERTLVSRPDRTEERRNKFVREAQEESSQ